MNKFSKMILGAAVSAMVLSGCRNQEVVAPTVTNPNQFPNGVVQKRVTVSLQIIASSEKGRAEGLSGAQVIVSQNGATSTKSTDKDGIVIFSDLFPGDFRYYVSIPNGGFSAVNGTQTASAVDNATIGANGNNTNQNVPSNNAFQVNVPRLGAGLTGKVFTNEDFNPLTSPTLADGYVVRVQFANTIQPNVYYATVSGGTFTFNNLPEASITGFSLVDRTVNGRVFNVISTTVDPTADGATAPTLKADVVKSFTSDLYLGVSAGIKPNSGSISGRLIGELDVKFNTTSRVTELDFSTGAFQLDASTVGGNEFSVPGKFDVYASKTLYLDYTSASSGVITVRTTTDVNGNFTFSNLPTDASNFKIYFDAADVITVNVTPTATSSFTETWAPKFATVPATKTVGNQEWAYSRTTQPNLFKSTSPTSATYTTGTPSATSPAVYTGVIYFQSVKQ